MSGRKARQPNYQQWQPADLSQHITRLEVMCAYPALPLSCPAPPLPGLL